MFRTKYIISILLALCVCASGFSQSGLRSLPEDPAVERGVLPNGTSYFLVSNPWRKGVAEIAVMQRVCQTDPDLPAAVLPTLAGDEGGQFAGFLARGGVLPGPEGYFKASADRTLYRFRDVPLSKSNFTDSLLMYVFRIMEKSMEASPEKYGTDNQTVIISGDIDKAAMKSKLRMFSLSTPSAELNLPAYEYVWDPDSAPLCVRTVTASDSLRTIEFSFRTKAVAAKQRKTVLPLVSARMDAVLANLLRESVENNLMLRKVRSDVSVLSDRAVYEAGDGHCTIKAVVDSSDSALAEAVIAGTIAEMASKGFNLHQFKWAADMAERRAFALRKAPLSNSEYVDKCVASALYGSGIVTAEQAFDIFAGRAIPDTTLLRIFNRYAKGMLSHIAETGAEQALSCRILDLNYGDTIAFAAPARKKVRLKKEKDDPVSGGKAWTFSNGTEVMYRKMDTGGMTYWTLAVPGAAALGPDFTHRSIRSVNAVPSGSHFALLSSLGVSIRMRVAGGFLIVDGASPSGSFVLSLRSLADLLATDELAGLHAASGRFVVVTDMQDFRVQDGLKPYLGLLSAHEGSQQRSMPPAETSVVAGPVGNASGAYANTVSLLGQTAFSSSNYILALVLERAVEYALARRLAGEGAYARVSCHFMNGQVEGLRFDMGFGPVEGQTQPEGTGCYDAEKTRRTVNAFLADCRKNGLPEDCVTLARTMVLSELDAAWKSPLQPLFASRLRFMYGKNIFTGYAEKLKSVDKAAADRMLDALLEGSRTDH